MHGAKTPWTDVKPAEMYRFLSIVVYLGLTRVTAARDLRRKDRLFRFPFPGEVMKSYRFIAISANFHMSDPATDVVNERRLG